MGHEITDLVIFRDAFVEGYKKIEGRPINDADVDTIGSFKLYNRDRRQVQ